MLTRKLAALFAGTYQGAGACFVAGPVAKFVDILPVFVGGIGVNPPTITNPLATLADNLPVNTPYVPANVLDWNGVQPLTLQSALDRIAAKITPIP